LQSEHIAVAQDSTPEDSFSLEDPDIYALMEDTIVPIDVMEDATIDMVVHTDVMEDAMVADMVVDTEDATEEDMVDVTDVDTAEDMEDATVEDTADVTVEDTAEDMENVTDADMEESIEDPLMKIRSGSEFPSQSQCSKEL